MRTDESELTEGWTTYMFLNLLPSFISFQTSAKSLFVIKGPLQHCITASMCVYLYAHERERGQGQVFIVTHSVSYFFLKAQEFWISFMECSETTVRNRICVSYYCYWKGIFKYCVSILTSKSLLSTLSVHLPINKSFKPVAHLSSATPYKIEINFADALKPEILFYHIFFQIS